MACSPLPFLFSFFWCGFILHRCSWFNYSFIFPNIFFIFLILFSLILYCTFFSFFLFFFSYCTTKLAESWFPGRRSGNELLWWELRVQTAGLTENLRPQGISFRVRPPRGPHLSTKTQLYPTACKHQCWTSQAKQPVRHKYSTTHQKKMK